MTLGKSFNLEVPQRQVSGDSWSEMQFQNRNSILIVSSLCTPRSHHCNAAWSLSWHLVMDLPAWGVGSPGSYRWADTRHPSPEGGSREARTPRLTVARVVCRRELLCGLARVPLTRSPSNGTEVSLFTPCLGHPYTAGRHRHQHNQTSP